MPNKKGDMGDFFELAVVGTIFIVIFFILLPGISQDTQKIKQDIITLKEKSSSSNLLLRYLHSPACAQLPGHMTYADAIALIISGEPTDDEDFSKTDLPY